MKGSIKTKLTLIMLSFTLVVGVSLSSVFLAMTRANMTSLSEEHFNVLEYNATDAYRSSLEHIIQQLAQNLVNPVYYNELTDIQQLLSATKNIDNINEIVLLDTERKIISDGSSDFLRMGLTLDLSPATWDSLDALTDSLNDGLKNGHSYSALEEKEDGGISILQPIFLGDQPIGYLYLSSNQYEMLNAIQLTKELFATNNEQFIKDFSLSALLITFALMALAGLGCWLVSDWFTSPIKILQKQALQMGAGNLQINDRVKRRDEVGDLAQSIYTMAADLELQNRSVKYLAFHDPLTGLSNRINLQMDLDEQIVLAANDNKSCAIMFIDLDDFKEINDARGHDVGDQALKVIADRITDSTLAFYRGGDTKPTIARIGGDEFTIVLPGNKDQQELRRIAELILTNISQPLPIDNGLDQLSGSIGIARFPRDGDSAAELLNAADAAMYKSKFAGKGTYRFFEEGMLPEEDNSRKIKIDFKKAVTTPGELQLLYQPIVNIKSGEIYGGEALMRWNHPTLGLLNPAQFISVVENNEIALSADLWVIETTLKTLSLLDLDDRQNFVISANISASNLGREQFPEAVADIINRSSVHPKHLQLEVTETYLHRDEAKALQSLKALESLGVKLWLDDFCTGYSSLKHLHMFPANGIKIDRQFIINISTRKEDRLLVSAMIDLANSFNIGVVAEGIDNQIDRELLIALNCEMGQGDLFSLPLAQEKFIALIKNKTRLPLANTGGK